jgi:hypothetical protein
MQIKEAVLAALKELVLPELAATRQKLGDIDSKLALVNQCLDDVNRRLDDVNVHLIDQSRRIDETNKRIDVVREDLTGRLESVRAELTGHINSVRAELTGRLDDNNKRLDNLFGVVVRRDEYSEVRPACGSWSRRWGS